MRHRTGPSNYTSKVLMLFASNTGVYSVANLLFEDKRGGK